MPDREWTLQYFRFEHLPPHLAEVSRPFAVLAQGLVDNLPRNPERSVALRKLIEAKDAAVRAALAKTEDAPFADVAGEGGEVTRSGSPGSAS